MTASPVARDTDRLSPEEPLPSHLGKRIRAHLRKVPSSLSPKTALSLSVVLTFVVIVATISAISLDGSDDDWSISVALSGRYPESGLCLFVNALISNIVFALNSAAPDLNWFFVLEYALSYASFFALCLAVFNFAPFGAALVIVGASLYFMVPGCTYNSNFTFVASMSTAAGFSCLLGPLSVRRVKPGFLIAGIIFAFAGSLFRIESFLLSLPFAILTLGYLAIRDRRGYSSANLAAKPFCIALAVLTVFVLGSIAYDKAVWGQNNWREWQEFNSPRATLSDYPAIPYQRIERDNPNPLLSENDYYLALNWVTADPDVFNVASLSEIASSDDSRAIEKLANGFLPYLASFGRKGVVDPAYLFPIAAIIAFLYAQRNGRIAIILSLLCCVACCSYFFGSGRMPDRVETPIWLYMALSSSFIAFASATASAPPSTAAHSIHLAAPRRHSNLPPLAPAAALVGGAVCAVTLCAFLTKALLAFDPSIIHDAVRQTNVEPNGPLYEYAMRDDGMINIWNTDACLYAEKEFKHRNLPSREYLLKNPCVGGWSSESPFIEARNREIGMESLLKGLVEQPNTRFICIDERHASAILTFLREHGHPQAQMKQVDSIFVDPAHEEKDYLFNVYEYYEG